ncbi:cytochrome c [Marinobacterium lutimaris]|uniref:Cytochrome c, mono-and diheme variants n=1 Tax=Marinobacterium lutimaris TaxID=568106 RepID=A0A1H6CUS7_9GAMM|nr:cytochrome c [Marinobacterium lutimaris]SEG76265.1 Cytochrome c, mono-and diheme variants [Marinobacterium lutimaris]
MMKKLTASLIFGASVLLSPLAMAAASDDPAVIAKGEYLAEASDCTACHTQEHGGKPFAGGKAIHSPVGEIFATNITPSKQFGIGNYSEEQFANALRNGVAADGSRLYPAMPYTAYAKLTDEDIHALYSYFMHGVEPVDNPTSETVLPFPMNLRFSMAIWNTLFHDNKPHEDDPSKSAEWNRGRYLAEGPTHCSTCHTPRGFMMQELGDQNLAGAQVGPWYAPNITPDDVSGIGSWSKAELVEYLKTGRIEGKAQAAGSMAEAVTNSFQHLTDEDLNAIAEYVMSVPAINNASENRFNQGEAGNQLAQFRGKAFDAETEAEGARIYSGNCAACHGYNGQGTADGYYPSMFNNSVTGEENTSNLIAAIIYGVHRETEAGGNVFMPPFGDQPNALNSLSDEQIATLSNYLMDSYGLASAEVTPEQVAVIRAGGEKSPLVQQARIGMAAGAVIVVLLLLGFVLRRKRRS